MDDFLHREIDAGPDDVIEVLLDYAANVQLLDPANYDRYRLRQPYHYYGGYVTQSPYRIQPPFKGHWHLVVDLGGGAGMVKAAVRTSGALSS